MQKLFCRKEAKTMEVLIQTINFLTAVVSLITAIILAKNKS